MAHVVSFLMSVGSAGTLSLSNIALQAMTFPVEQKLEGGELAEERRRRAAEESEFAQSIVDDDDMDGDDF
jgi:hypothetical protein